MSSHPRIIESWLSVRLKSVAGVDPEAIIAGIDARRGRNSLELVGELARIGQLLMQLGPGVPGFGAGAEGIASAADFVECTRCSRR